MTFKAQGHTYPSESTASTLGGYHEQMNRVFSLLKTRDTGCKALESERETRRFSPEAAC